MSDPTYLSGNDWENVPNYYSLLNSEPPAPNFTTPPPIPVSARIFVPTSLVPSAPEVPSPPIVRPSPLSPSSSRSLSSSESSNSFESHNRAQSSAASSSHVPHQNPSDCELGRGQGNLGRSSPLSTAATSPASSEDHLQILPVSLSIDDPEWVHILAGLSPTDDGGIEEFTSKVREDSRRVGYLKEIRGSREHNRLADLRDEPLTPIPNRSGLIMPLGYHHPITSISQIYEMRQTELDGWLLHYDIQSAPGVKNERSKQRSLARHVGVVTPNIGARTEASPLVGLVSS